MQRVSWGFMGGVQPGIHRKQGSVQKLEGGGTGSRANTYEYHRAIIGRDGTTHKKEATVGNNTERVGLPGIPDHPIQRIGSMGHDGEETSTRHAVDHDSDKNNKAGAKQERVLEYQYH